MLMKELVEKTLDSQLWHACAGGMVQMPSVNAKVFYFPQGHAEHTQSTVDFGIYPKIPPMIPCRVVNVRFLADPETDEVYSKLRLVPLRNGEFEFDSEDGEDGVLGGSNESDTAEKPASFAKTLTQSDANNGGGFSVPRYCAETIFPRLDYSADPPVQTVIAKDVHGNIWKFRHIYRGTPRRHLLTTGWSTFVNHKKLVAGDSIVFLRAENGDLCVGIRRAKRGIGGAVEPPCGWNSTPQNCISPYGRGFSMFLREDDNKFMGTMSCGNSVSSCAAGSGKRVMAESVIEAAALAANGQPFEVVYYPRASTPEFCVKVAAVKTAMRIQWCPSMRFKMAFETEDSSRISWFMGVISSVQVADPIRWPNSPWRLLQVTWDEPDLLQNVKRVSPWLVELVTNMPIINLSPFSPPRKKLRFPQQPDFLFDGQFPVASFSGNPHGTRSSLCCNSDNTPPGIQGARHAQFGISVSDLQHNSKLHSGLFPLSHQRLNLYSAISSGTTRAKSNENISCLLTIGNSTRNLEKPDKVKRHQFVLFGQPILTEQEIANNSSSSASSQVSSMKSSSNGNLEKATLWSNGLGSKLEWPQVQPNHLSSDVYSWHKSFQTVTVNMEIGQCKVFVDSEDVGRTLDLSILGSYDQLYRTLSNMFGIDVSEMLSRVVYQDELGTLKRTGDEPFSDFMKTAKRLTVLLDPANNNIGRKRITGLENAKHGLGSSNKAGPLSIFA